MDICLCDHTVERLLDSLVPEVQSAYGHTTQPSIIAIGPSGRRLAERLAKELERTTGGAVDYHLLEVEGRGDRVPALPYDPSGRSLLICDGIVNSGRTMFAVRSHLLAKGASEVLSAALVVRNGSRFIPNFYVVGIDAHDAIFFDSDRYPVRQTQVGTIRMADPVLDGDGVLEVPETYVSSSIADYLYTQARDPSWKTYVIETNGGKLAGMLHFRHDRDSTVFFDTLAVSVPFRGLHFAAALLGFLDEYCRFNRVSRCTMFAIEDKVGMYEAIGYRITGKTLALPYGKFCEMEMFFP